MCIYIYKGCPGDWPACCVATSATRGSVGGVYPSYEELTRLAEIRLAQNSSNYVYIA